MKSRAVFYLVMAVFIGLVESSFASEEAKVPPQVESVQGNMNHETQIQGTEDEHITSYGYQAGESGTDNTFIGAFSGLQTSGSRNTFVGHMVCPLPFTGSDNTYIGYQVAATAQSSAAGGNTIVGSEAGTYHKNGGYNSFFGYRAGMYNTGAYNAFFGENAGLSNMSGKNNSFFGSQAGLRNTTGEWNTFVGKDAGLRNEEAHRNTFIGAVAGSSNNTGTQNTFVGTDAGRENTGGSNNIFVGFQAGLNNLTGGGNTFVGTGAGVQSKLGSNTFVGYHAGYSNEDGFGNVFLGYNAGSGNMGGDNNVFLGYAAGSKETNSYRLYIDCSDTKYPLVWGNFDTNNITIYGGFRSIASYSTSDVRLKKNIVPLKSSLEKISSLQGVSYEWKIDEHPDMGMTTGKQIGLVAQDVEKVLPELVSEDKDGNEAISYTKLTAVLVEAVKDLKAQNEKQQAEINRLRELVKDSKM